MNTPEKHIRFLESKHVVNQTVVARHGGDKAKLQHAQGPKPQTLASFLAHIALSPPVIPRNIIGFKVTPFYVFFEGI